MYMQFKIARYDRNKGVWVTNKRQLAWAYLRTTFFIDLLSTIPWELLGFFFEIKCLSCRDQTKKSNTRLMRLLKLMKVFKLARIFRTSRLFEYIKNKFRLKSAEYMLLKYAGVLIISLHWTACAWGIFPQLDTTGTDIEMSHHLPKSDAEYIYTVSRLQV
jgi:hypothetical protein